MRITIFLLIAFGLQAGAKTFSQNVTLNMRNAPLIKVLDEVEKQTGYSFIYEKSQLLRAGTISIDVKNGVLPSVLEQVLKNQPLNFSIREKFIVLSPKLRYRSLEQPDFVMPETEIKGRVTDQNDKPIARATVMVKGGVTGTYTDKEGNFRLLLRKIPAILVVSYVGYTTKEVVVSNMDFLNIKLHTRTLALNEAVVSVSTGMFARRKETFTGATATYTGDQLKLISNQNVIQSLRTLDPSFLIMENNIAGSNPNVMPVIEMRGQTSLTSNNLKDDFNNDPNQPLFILDGFITSLTIINNMDMNRVASITLLKDAASTALYGAKAANGVVVIETKKPRTGKVRLSYSGDFNIQLPDLSGYNMMNASEELMFEKLSGRYTSYSSGSYTAQYYLDSLYNAHLAQVQRGVNSYWLSEPVRKGYMVGNSLYAEGGDTSLKFGLGFSYKNIEGVMKGSGRKMYSGSIDLAYRKGKFNFANKFYMNGYSANGSHYGSFQTFVNAPAYYSKRDPDGIAQPYLEISRNYYSQDFYVSNPLYNAELPFIDNEKAMGFTNNLQAIYTITPALQLSGGLSINQNATTNVHFVSPDNTIYIDSTIFTKGEYNNKKINSFGYQTNLGLTYGKLFNNVHQLTANLRAELEESNNTANAYTAVGFPSGSNGNPAFSFGYEPGGKPYSVTSKYRRNNAVASLNYAFARRYFVDATYRIDGSTSFGSNKKYTSFWSAGAGWNLHNEKMFSQYSWLNVMRLRANIGTSGNQSLGAITSVSTYNYDSYINQFGQGVYQVTMANPNLKWQVTTTTNIGMDVMMCKNRLSLNGNIYSKITDPMVIVVDLPSSTGLKGYPLNAGKLRTKGMDVTARYFIINKTRERINWNIGATAGMLKSEYENFNATLDGLNKQNQLNNSLTRYKDGYSSTDLWAVASAGIDPASGREVFISKEGKYTYTYNANDIVKVGNSQPVIQGVFSTYFSYKGLVVSASVRYSYGADAMNSALFNKVENISYKSIGNNQDKRALYDRWKKPGDITQFKGISLVDAMGNGVTRMSSRFIQQDNYVSGESFSAGYDFSGRKWLRHAGMEGLRITAYANDIFRISSVKRERGTDYPYAQTISLSVNASF